MNLVIIESPGKVKKLKSILGDDWEIVPSYGHIRDLPSNEMGIVAPDFIPSYELSEKGTAVVAKIKRLASKASAIYFATDPDREGEAISWHLEQEIKPKSYLRVAWGEVTAGKVKTALQNPRVIDRLLVAGQETRRNADRLVGYMVSGPISRIAGETLSAGRVQSPAVKIIVLRERAIAAFKKVQHFGAAIQFLNGDGSRWIAEWQTKPFVTASNPYMLDSAFAESVSTISEVKVIDYDESVSRRAPPAPFITATLQQAASVALGFEPDKTMELAQALFDNGHITYHRTDNPNVSEESLGDIYEAALVIGIPMADEPRTFEASEGAQVGHPATTPTHWEAEVAGETDEQRALYRLIRLRAIASQLADARYTVRSVILEGTEQGSGKTVRFVASGRTLIDAGWRGLVKKDQTEDEAGEGEEGADNAANESDNPIPELAVGEVLKPVDGKLMAKATKAPKRFTLAALIAELERLGIGRPATYASIMKGILDRGYVIKKARHVVPLPKGEMLVSLLDGNFTFMDFNYTKSIEQKIDLVSKGEIAYREVMNEVHDDLIREIAEFESKTKPRVACPKCEAAMRRIEGKRGYFWGCTNHPDCAFIYEDKDGEPVKRAPLELSEHVCPKCSSALVNIKQAAAPGKVAFNFWVCSGKKIGCKNKYPDRNGVPALPAK